MRPNKFFTITVFSAIVAMTFSGCSRSAKQDGLSHVQSASAFDPTPQDTATLGAQLQRFKGQTKFLNVSDSTWGVYYRAAAPSRTENDAFRDIQEADIFKVGPEGSKLLYLLNNYRGLQVISYENGENEPIIKGRIGATGNYPDSMYSDEDKSRLLVLENLYFSADADFYDYSSQQSRLLVYTVADPANPQIAQELKLEGNIQESRMVGNVLYVATSVRPSWNEQQSGNLGSGYVYSFSLTGDSVQQVEVLQLSAPVNYGETMNVVETEEDGAKKYYLIAALASSSWTWFGKRPLEVVDISDPYGNIKSLMVVESRGQVSERSQTIIKNGALIVTSNYLVSEDRLRIAVESFILPTANATIIDSLEAEYRKFTIDRTARKLRKDLENEGVQRDEIEIRVQALIDQLMESEDLKLRGVFVRKSGQEGLSKLTPDDSLTFGSTTGISAQLQDTRFDGNLLYAFWVPANNIDPLDVVDISNPNELVHLSHLEFDGWIQRAIPVAFDNKNYIVGLGWIIPAVGEDQRRFPQAAIFEIVRTESGVNAKLIAQKNLASSSVWANFNASDKEIEFRRNSNNVATILYAFSSWTNGSYTSGGQLIEVDLNKIVTAPSEIFHVGGILRGDDGWMRRIFTNDEIARVNTFSDLALGTFEVINGIGAADQIIEAANTLELARNLVDFIPVNIASDKYGLQVIASERWWNRSSDETTEFRLVRASNADAELGPEVPTVSVPGTYVDSVVDGGRILVLVKQWREPEDSATDRDWTQILTIHEIGITGPQSIQVVAKASLGDFSSYIPTTDRGDARNFLKMKNGNLVVSYGSHGFLVGASVGDQIGVTAMQLDSCLPSERMDLHFHELSGNLWAHFTQNVADPNRVNYNYVRHFISGVAVDGSSCTQPVNIPGIPLMINDGKIITKDSRLLDIQRHGDEDHTYYIANTDNVLSSLKLSENQASLVDLYDVGEQEISSLITLDSGHLMFVESTQKPAYWFLSPPRVSIRPGIPSPTLRDNRLVVLGYDDEQNFTKRSFSLGNIKQHLTLGKVTQSGNDLLAVTKQGSAFKVWKLDQNWILTAKKLQTAEGEAYNNASVPGWFYGSLDRTIQIDEEGSVLRIINGYFGIYDFRIVD